MYSRHDSWLSDNLISTFMMMVFMLCVYLPRPSLSAPCVVFVAKTLQTSRL